MHSKGSVCDEEETPGDLHEYGSINADAGVRFLIAGKDHNE